MAKRTEAAETPWDEPGFIPPTGRWTPPAADASGDGSKERTRRERLNLLWHEVHGDRVSDQFRETGDYGRGKLRKLRSYLYAYSVILAKHFPGKFAYIDAEAGPGFLRTGPVPDPRQSRLFDDAPIRRPEILGSPMLALSNHPHYPIVHFVEIHGKTHDALKARVDHYYPGRANVHRGDCNKLLPEIAATLPAGSRAFFFLDPKGLELRMETMRQTKNAFPGAEFLLLYPYHMAFRRCLNHEDSENTMTAFWGDATWQNFRDNLEKAPQMDPEEIFLQAYMARIRALGFRHVYPTHTIKADDGRELYYLLFATNNDNARRIFEEIDSRHAR